MPFLMPIGFVGTPSAAGASATATAGSFTAVFLDSDHAVNNATSYALSGLDFGTAAANRLLIAGIHNTDPGTSPAVAPSTVRIGGVDATLVVGKVDDEAYSSIWQALVPSGTSGAVSLTFSRNQQNVGVGLWSIKTNTQAAQNTGSAAGTSSIAATVPSGGYAIAVATRDTGTTDPAGSIAPSNYTEDYDICTNDTATNGDAVFEGGHFTASATINATYSGGTGGGGSGRALVYASWGP